MTSSPRCQIRSRHLPSTLSPRARLRPLEARKLIPRPLPQPLQRGPHLRQLALQLQPRGIIRAAVQLHVDLALRLARRVGGVLAQRLGHELDVQGRLHQRRQGVARAGAEGFQQGGGELLEEVRQDGYGERLGGGGDFGVDGHEEEEGFVDVRPHFGGARGGGDPGRGGDARADEGGERFTEGARVGLEEAGVDLGEDVVDGCGLFGELNGEVGFELGDELGDDGGAEGFEVAEGEEHAKVLGVVSCFVIGLGNVSLTRLLASIVSLLVSMDDLPTLKPAIESRSGVHGFWSKLTGLSAFSTMPDRVL